ncbi:glucose-specific phosphotransferase system IIA component [Lactobacillus colini]|uniref:Glucose-specific phosphotransferase system IIA component n=1 Tax=Lactobacillus colini TaxID=1819254 RepID=A0ABS4MFN0_9LACO|nr:glucose PTS transporter subunit IIA [Lactobacillus colini]MBP2058493.1 glucose-specific phosphotransferase system IIA component [Lactobacillus colini]
MDYHKIGKDIVKNVGGKANISNLTHCATRLRFTLKDVSKAKKNAIENIDGVVGVVYAGGQYMVIMGQHLIPTYEAIVKDTKIETGAPINENLDSLPEDKWTWKNSGSKIISFVQATVTPMIPGLIAGGMLKVFLIIITTFIAPAWAKTNGYLLISAVADAPFYFMPIMVAYGAAKKLGATPVYAMMASAALLHPNFTGLVSQFAANPNLKVSLFAMPIKLLSYSTSLLPAILITICAYWCEKILNKVIPGIFKTIFVGAGTIFIAGTLGYLILGPLGDYIGQIIAGIFMFLSKTVGPIAVGLLAAALPWMVMTGMHQAITPFMPQLLSNPGYDALLRPAFLVHNMAEGGANVGVALRAKSKKLRREAWSLAVGALVAGVTEPSIYGINFKYKKPMYGVMAGGFAGGVVASLMGARAYVMGYSNLLALPIFEKTAVGMLIGAVVAIIVAALVTFVIGFDEENVANKITEPVKETFSDDAILSPATGELEDLSQVKDEAFASKALGDGVAVKLDGDFVTAPANGKLTALFPTGHAFGIVTNEGIEILVHIGINTVNLKGEGFDVLVHQDDKVRAGQPIVRINRKKIEEMGYDLTTMMIFTNPNGKNIKVKTKGKVEAGTQIN